jgi:hypothetical protein
MAMALEYFDIFYPFIFRQGWLLLATTIALSLKIRGSKTVFLADKRR